MWGGCNLQYLSIRLEERPGELQTSSTWLPSLGAGQAMSAGVMDTWHLSWCIEVGHITYTHVMLGSCLSASHTMWHLAIQCDTWVLSWCWPNHFAHVAFGLLTWWLGTTQNTRCAWVALSVTYVYAPLGDTWRLGSAAKSKENESVLRVQDQRVWHQDLIIIGSSIKTQSSWVLGF